MFKSSRFKLLMLLLCLSSCGLCCLSTLTTTAHGKFSADLRKAEEIAAKRLSGSISREAGEEYLFSCNFDDNDCKIEIDEDDLVSGAKAFEITPSLVTLGSYQFTDVTSITEPTANGQVCQIPFKLSETEYFHCTEKNQCITSSGISSCKSGSFLNGQFSTPENRNTIYFPVLSDYYGDMIYELNFQAFMYCEGDVKCTESNDIIQVGVYSYGADGALFKVTKVLKFSDFTQPKAWQAFSLKLSGIDNVFYVEVVVVKDFYSQISSTTYYGIDNIQVKFVERYDQVYKCDLDSSNCFDTEGEVFKNVFWRHNIVVESNVFTDYSSTNKPAENGVECKIPFYDNGKIRYHCNEENKCLTSSNFSACAAGKFLGGYTNNSVSDFFFEQSITTIKLPSTSVKYRLTFNAFMYCDGDDETCQQTTNFIHLYAYNQNFLATDQLLRLRNFDGRTAWKKFEGFFEPPNSTIFVKFMAGRYSSSDAITYFGIDELQVALVSAGMMSEPITTVSSSSPSSASPNTISTSMSTRTSTTSSQSKLNVNVITLMMIMSSRIF